MGSTLRDGLQPIRVRGTHPETVIRRGRSAEPGLSLGAVSPVRTSRRRSRSGSARPT
ncbi:hypothetical protein ACFPRL_21055 [Pseudoclavibacter helvolus]